MVKAGLAPLTGPLGYRQSQPLKARRKLNIALLSMVASDLRNLMTEDSKNEGTFLGSLAKMLLLSGSPCCIWRKSIQIMQLFLLIVSAKKTFPQISIFPGLHGP